MKLFIPTRYTLLGQTVNVKMAPYLLNARSARGEFLPISYDILLNPPDPEAGYPVQSVEQTFCHELTHSILHVMSEHKLYDNEKFVDLFGHCLHQALTTMK